MGGRAEHAAEPARGAGRRAAVLDPLTPSPACRCRPEIAVIDERIANILSRLEALTAALERLHESP